MVNADGGSTYLVISTVREFEHPSEEISVIATGVGRLTLVYIYSGMAETGQPGFLEDQQIVRYRLV